MDDEDNDEVMSLGKIVLILALLRGGAHVLFGV